MAVVALLPPVTGAQTPKARWEVFAEGGASTWNTHYFDTPIQIGQPPVAETLRLTSYIPSSGRLFVGVRFWIDTRDAIEASYSYAPADLAVNQKCNGVDCGLPASSTARLHLFSMNYVRAFRARSRVRPFLTAGLGLIYFRPSGQNQMFEPDRSTANFGGGVDLWLTHRWALRAEYREWIFESPRLSDDWPAGLTGLMHNQVPSVGLVYSF